jgi:AcrR family transcriptional regulator
VNVRSQTAAADLRASLVEHAQRLVAREGPAALTMRALALEAGCAVGLPYKVFADRQEIVLELVDASFGDMSRAGDELFSRAGSGSVAGNLAWFAEWLLDSPGVALAQYVLRDEGLANAAFADFHSRGTGPTMLETILSGYLGAEQRAGRVARDVDVDGFGFVLAGAIHHLVVMGDGYPRPSKRRLARILASITDRL